MNRGIAFLLIAVITGFYTFFSASWSLVYKINLFLHPITAVVSAYFYYYFLIKSKDWDLLKKIILPAAIISAIGGLIHFPESINLFKNLLLIFIYPIVHIEKVRKDLEKFLTQATIFYFTELSITGLIFGLALGGRSVHDLMLSHNIISFALAFTLSISWLLRWKIPAKKNGLFSAFHRLGAFLKSYWGFLVMSLVLCILVSEVLSTFIKHQAAWNLAPMPYEERHDFKPEFTNVNLEDRPLLSRSKSCATEPGCHEINLKELKISMHGRSLQVDYAQKLVSLLDKERGEKNERICASCHYPNMILSNYQNIKMAYTNLNQYCTFCHQVSSVTSHKDPAYNRISLQYNINHLRMFEYKKEDKISSFNRLLINLNLDGHARVFQRPLYREDKFCLGCHIQIIPSSNLGLQKPSCIACHMQDRGQFKKQNGGRNHVFPAQSTQASAFIRTSFLSRLNENFSRGNIKVPLKGWGSFWEPRNKAKGRMNWLVQKAMPLIEKNKFGVRIITINASIDHKFPSGSLDLIDVWQKIKITDDKGRVLLNRGEVSKSHEIDPEAHKLGGYVLDKAGKKTKLYRPWTLKKIVYVRGIALSHSVYDDYYLKLPQDAKYLIITSSWMYRDLNKSFIHFAYPQNNTPVKLVTLHTIHVKIPVNIDKRFKNAKTK